MVRDLLTIGFFAVVLSGMVIGIWKMVDSPLLPLPPRPKRGDPPPPAPENHPGKK